MALTVKKDWLPTVLIRPNIYVPADPNPCSKPYIVRVKAVNTVSKREWVVASVPAWGVAVKVSPETNEYAKTDRCLYRRK